MKCSLVTQEMKYYILVIIVTFHIEEKLIKGKEGANDLYVCSVQILKVLVMLSCRHEDETVGFKRKAENMLASTDVA